MRLYENDIQTTLVETYSRKEKELDVGEKTYVWHYWDLVQGLRRRRTFFFYHRPGCDIGFCRPDTYRRTGYVI